MKIKDIALSAAYVGQRVVKAIAVGAQEVWSAVKYIVFKDPVVEQICATNFGDGVGLSEEQAAKVTSIGLVFQRNTEITSFDELAEFENVKAIPQSAFYGCTNLKSIKFPDGLESIGVQSFQSCGLLSFTYPTSLKSIGNYAFMGCDKLKTIFADSIEHIFAVEYAYFPFQGLQEGAQTTIYVNGEILTETDIPLGVEKIPPYIFYSNQNIVRIGIPQTITSIGGYSFAYCNNLESDIILPSGVTSVGDSAFRGCSNVASYSLNEGLTSIGQYAFSRIGNRETFTIPSTVTSIGGAAFFSSQIKDLIIKAVAPPTAGNILLSCDAIYVPDQSVKAYREASVWSGYADKIWPMEAYLYGIITFADPAVEAICLANWDTNGSGYLNKEEAKAVTDLGTVFKGNTEIASFDELGEFTGVTSLSDAAFEGCTNLTSIDLSNITKFGRSSFRQCTSLSIDFANNVITTIPAMLFDGATSIKSVSAPNVEVLGWAAFNNCQSLSGDIYFPKLRVIESNQHFTNTKIERIVSLGVVESLPYAFCSGSKELLSVVLPKSIKTISNSFTDCSKLKTINLPVSITQFDGTFNNDFALVIDTLELPNLSGSISRLTFSGPSITHIKNLGKITAVDFAAFTNNKVIKDITIPYTMSVIADRAFDSSRVLDTVVMHPLAPPTLATASSIKSAVAISYYVPNESIDAYMSAWTDRASAIKPITNYITFTDITSSLVSDVVYNTALDVYAQFDDTTISEAGAKSMIYDLDGSYDTLKIMGNGRTTSRLYCFIDENNEVITTADESLSAAPLYICIPSMARKMVICCDATSTNVKVEIGKHVE